MDDNTLDRSALRGRILDDAKWTYNNDPFKKKDAKLKSIEADLRSRSIGSESVCAIKQKYAEKLSELKDKYTPRSSDIDKTDNELEQSFAPGSEAQLGYARGIGNKKIDLLLNDAFGQIQSDIAAEKPTDDGAAGKTSAAGAAAGGSAKKVPEGVKEKAARLSGLNCFYGKPPLDKNGKLDTADKKITELANSKTVVLDTKDGADAWNRDRIKDLKDFAKTQGNSDIQILSYISVGGASPAEITEFEKIIQSLNLQPPPKNIWMNKASGTDAAQIDLSDERVADAWTKFKQTKISESLAVNTGGGVFFDDSDVINRYNDRFNSAKTPEEKRAYQGAINRYTEVFGSCCEEARRSGADGDIVINRGLDMRDPFYYRFEDENGGWELSTNWPGGHNERGTGKPPKNQYKATQDMLYSYTSSTAFENITAADLNPQSGSYGIWKKRIQDALTAEPPRIINIIAYKYAVLADGTKEPTGPDKNVLTTEINKWVEESAAANGYNPDDLRQLVSIRYYDTNHYHEPDNRAVFIALTKPKPGAA